jgi:hypothetical protein
MLASRFRSFQEFWPFYLGQHSKPLTRRLHFTGTDIAVAAVLYAVWAHDARYLLLALVAAYGLAWIGHYFIERNRPATFTYPLWSFAADWKMWAFMWTGRLDGELRRHGVVD